MANICVGIERIKGNISMGDITQRWLIYVWGYNAKGQYICGVRMPKFQSFVNVICFDTEHKELIC